MNIPDYRRNDPKGWCGDPKRGAALGRRSIHSSPDFSGEIMLSKVQIDADGYDPLGTYFGVGLALYWAATADGNIDFMLRAPSIEDAETKVRARYPNSKVVRA